MKFNLALLSRICIMATVLGVFLLAGCGGNGTSPGNGTSGTPSNGANPPSTINP
jgi:hypothetical protein